VRRRLVVLGMMAKIPVPGVLWQTLHYLVGFERLGFETYYVEAHARTPSMLMESAYDDGSGRAAALLGDVLGRFDFGDRWTYWALHDDGSCFGRSERQLRRLLREAELIVNLHGATDPLPELAETGRLVYLETDPVRLQIELHNGLQPSIDFLAAHAAHFTFAENLGTEVCDLPISEQFEFRPTRQPVVLDFWRTCTPPGDLRFTTVGNWRQRWRSVDYEGERYGWSKDEEWSKVLDLPQRTGQRFELALSGAETEDEEVLRARGWEVRPALELTLDSYHDYIIGSSAELTVAKDQNVRFRTGWFSDRSATYLAAGRPVITQDTGFDQVLPTGAGLFSFRNEPEAALAVQLVAADWSAQSRAALEIGREFFAAERVLGRLLSDVGVSVKRQRKVVRRPARRKLGPDSRVLALIPHFKCEDWLDDCLSSLATQTRPLDGIVVIDDASEAPPVELVSRHPGITLLHAGENVGPYRLVQQVIDETDYDAYLFQDADDWSAPDRLERLLEGAAATGAELIGSQEVRVFCDEPEAVPIQWPLDGNAPFENVPTAFTCLHPTSLVSRDLVQAVGGFSSGLRFGGDAEFLRRAHWIATVANVPHYSYLRRIRQDSLTTAPETAIGSPVRKELMDETFARARANHTLVEQGLEPDLSPLRTRDPVELRRLCGPPLQGMSGSRKLPHRRHRKVGPPRTQANPPVPVFVVSAERSGGSALACALGQHPAIAYSQHGGHLGRLAAAIEAVRAQALDEDANAFGVDPPDAATFAAELGSAISALARDHSRYVVDGSWQHARHAEELARLFPAARFIHIVRDVHSAVRALADPPLGAAGATGGTQIPARLRAKVSESEAIERWVRAVESCLDLESVLPSERVLTVRYDDLLTDPAMELDRCLAFLGEEPAAECMRPLRAIRTLASAERLEPDVEPELWQRAVRLSRELCGVTKSARIVMVTDHFPKVSETFFVDKFLGLRRRGWDVHVVSQRSNKEHWEFFPTLRDEIGDSDERLHVARDNLEEKLAELEPDLVHFGYGVLAAGRMHLRDALGCRAIVSFRGFDLNSFRLDDPSVYDDVWRSADMLHLVSENLWRQAQLRGCPPDRPHTIIHDAVDVSQLHAPVRRPEEVGTADRPLRLLSVGRLHWKKGHEYALEAVKLLTDKGLAIDYRIVGEGDQRDSTEFAIRDFGVAESVRLLGALPAGEVRELYAWADVLVHPSLTEAFGVAVAEGQAMQLPVVCSDAGGLSENVVDGFTGLVVPRRDPVGLAVAIARLAQDSKLRTRMGRAAGKHARTNLDLDRQLDKLEVVYREILERPAPTRRLSLHDARAKAEQETRDALRARVAQEPDPAAEEALWRREVVDRVVTYVDEQLKPGSRVLVVSRGDERIVDFPRHHGEHFPQSDDGQYAGHHPADSGDAIARLEALFASGAEYLVIPGTSAWWLDHYTEFATYLERRHTRVAAEDRTFVVYQLQPAVQAVA
jgi:glycosyltransferase involved in cell wall biosynthesis